MDLSYPRFLDTAHGLLALVQVLKQMTRSAILPYCTVNVAKMRDLAFQI